MRVRMKSRGRWTRVRVIELCLILLGLVLVGWYAVSNGGSSLQASYDSYKLDAQLRGEKPSVTGYVRDLFGAGASEEARGREPAEPAPVRRQRPPRGEVVGRLEIPRIKVSAVVREGADDKTLKKAAGHVAYTALPGEKGNVGIAAHRDSHFRNLRNVKEGDLISMVTPWGKYEYEVESLKIVTPKNVEVLHTTPEPSLTLVTCYPFNYVGSAPKRFIVRARQVQPSADNANQRAGASAPRRGTKQL